VGRIQDYSWLVVDNLVVSMVEVAYILVGHILVAYILVGTKASFQASSLA